MSSFFSSNGGQRLRAQAITTNSSTNNSKNRSNSSKSSESVRKQQQMQQRKEIRNRAKENSNTDELSPIFTVEPNTSQSNVLVLVHNVDSSYSSPNLFSQENLNPSFSSLIKTGRSLVSAIYERYGNYNGSYHPNSLSEMIMDIIPTTTAYIKLPEEREEDQDMITTTSASCSSTPSSLASSPSILTEDSPLHHTTATNKNNNYYDHLETISQVSSSNSSTCTLTPPDVNNKYKQCQDDSTSPLPSNTKICNQNNRNKKINNCKNKPSKILFYIPTTKITPMNKSSSVEEECSSSLLSLPSSSLPSPSVSSIKQQKLPSSLVMSNMSISHVGTRTKLSTNTLLYSPLSSSHEHLIELDVSHNDWSDWTEISKLLSEMPNLRLLNLSGVNSRLKQGKGLLYPQQQQKQQEREDIDMQQQQLTTQSTPSSNSNSSISSVDESTSTSFPDVEMPFSPPLPTIDDDNDVDENFSTLIASYNNNSSSNCCWLRSSHGHKLKVLILNGCSLPFSVLECLFLYCNNINNNTLPCLTELHLAANSYSNLNFSSSSFCIPSLRILYLNGNGFTSWFRLLGSISKVFPHLEQLVVSENPLFDAATDQEEGECIIHEYIHTLIANRTSLQTWSVLDKLVSSMPSLCHLRLQHVPLLSALSDADQRHYLLVAHLPERFLTVNGGAVSAEERETCERKYLRFWMDQNANGVYDRPQTRYTQLELKHGKLNRLADVNFDARKKVLVKINLPTLPSIHHHNQTTLQISTAHGSNTSNSNNSISGSVENRHAHFVYEKVDVRQTVAELKRFISERYLAGLPPSRFRLFYVDVEACQLAGHHVGPEELKHANRCLYSFGVRDQDEFEIDLKVFPSNSIPSQALLTTQQQQQQQGEGGEFCSQFNHRNYLHYHHYNSHVNNQSFYLPHPVLASIHNNGNNLSNKLIPTSPLHFANPTRVNSSKVNRKTPSNEKTTTSPRSTINRFTKAQTLHTSVSPRLTSNSKHSNTLFFNNTYVSNSQTTPISSVTENKDITPTKTIPNSKKSENLNSVLK